MPAPSLEALYGFENEIEPAWIAILTKRLGLQGYLAASDEQKETPFFEVQLMSVSDGDPHGNRHYHQFANPGTPAPSGKDRVPDVFTGILFTRIVTARGLNSNRQPELIGGVRIEALRWRENFQPPVLKYYGVGAFVQEGRPIRGFDSELGL